MSPLDDPWEDPAPEYDRLDEDLLQLAFLSTGPMMQLLLLVQWAFTTDQSNLPLEQLQVLTKWNVAGRDGRSSRTLLLAIARERRASLIISALREKMNEKREFIPDFLVFARLIAHAM